MSLSSWLRQLEAKFAPEQPQNQHSTSTASINKPTSNNNNNLYSTTTTTATNLSRSSSTKSNSLISASWDANCLAAARLTQTSGLAAERNDINANKCEQTTTKTNLIKPLPSTNTTINNKMLHNIINNNNNRAYMMSHRTRTSSRFCEALGSRLWLAACVTLIALTVCAQANGDYSNGQIQQQQIDIGQQQQQPHQVIGQYQPSPAKGKKIQIVYIKVPLAKLKPSLPVGQDSHGAGSNDTQASYGTKGGSINVNSNSTESLNEQANATSNSNSTAISNKQGSQPSDADSRATKDDHTSSFLIPMAVVQDHGPSDTPTPAFDLGRMAPAPLVGPTDLGRPTRELYQLSQQQQQHQGFAMQHPSGHVQVNQASRPAQFDAGYGFAPNRKSRGRQWPNMNHGFMSSFLFGEKEKLSAAAAMMMQHHQLLPNSQYLQHNQLQLQNQQLNHNHNHNNHNHFRNQADQLMLAAASKQQQVDQSQPQPQHLAPEAQQSQANQQAAQPTKPQPQTSQPQLPPKVAPSGPGGLMPPVMMPFSHMPDNMIGQAYNAAVRQALPSESGMPTSSLLGSPSSQAGYQAASAQVATTTTNHNIQEPQQAAQQVYTNGGKSGAAPVDLSSPQTLQFGSYVGSSANQQGGSSGATSYQGSSSGSGNLGHYSGFGSGIGASGASAAFSDYPAATANSATNSHQTGSPSTLPAPQAKGYQAEDQLQHQQQGPPAQPQAQGYATGNNQQYSQQQQQQRLKQAKKTIIPIVVQVEHAVLDGQSAYGGAQQQQQFNQQQGNRYGSAQRDNRQLGGRRHRQHPQQVQMQAPQQAGYPSNAIQNQAQNGYQNMNMNINNQNNFRQNNNHGQMYPAGSEMSLSALMGANPSNAQFLNAANAHDISQITASINAENAAAAAAALAQADSSFAPNYPQGIPAGHAPQQQQHGSPNQHSTQHAHSSAMRPARPFVGGAQQYAANLQSAASALLANSHPVIQAAASGSINSVTKLGAKLGEIIALPSMQVPSVISSMSSSIPAAWSQLTNQMGAQLNQAVQQVAKEHPMASTLVRQVAQHTSLGQAAGHAQAAAAGLQTAGSAAQQLMSAAAAAASSSGGPLAAASQLVSQAVASPLPNMFGSIQQASSSPIGNALPDGNSQNQALQNLRFNLGANLQSAAAQFMAANSKTNAQSAAQLLASPLSALYPASVNAALKQLQGVQDQAQVNSQQQQHHHPNGVAHGQQNGETQHAQSSQIDAVALHAAGPEASSSTPQSGAKSSLKSKFLSFFQPPKFISNLWSWNERADTGSSTQVSESQSSPSASTTTSSSTTTSTAATSTSVSTAAKTPANV